MIQRLLVAVGVFLAPVSGVAADLAVTITNARNADGSYLIAVCDEANFLVGECANRRKIPASVEPVRVVFPSLPKGRWAVQVVHDENDNFDLDRNFLGIPSEGYGFTNNPRGFFGPPDFDDAAFNMTDAAMELQIELYYWEK